MFLNTCLCTHADTYKHIIYAYIMLRFIEIYIYFTYVFIYSTVTYWICLLFLSVLFQLRGHALDKTGAKLEEPIDLPIKIVDINDNFPVFSHEVFVGSVEELSETGNNILRIGFFIQLFPTHTRVQVEYALFSSASAMTRIYSLACIGKVIHV